MSNYLFKGFFTVPEEEKRVIQSNEAMEKRIEELKEQERMREEAGFKSGLKVDYAGPADTELPEGEEVLVEGTTETSNVIKAAEINEKASIRADEIISKAKEEAAAITKEAYMAADRLRKETMKKVEIEKMEAVDMARKSAYQEGIEQARNEVESIKADCEERIKNLEKDFQEILDDIEPKLVETVLSVVEHIFKTDMSSYKELIITLAMGAIRDMEGSGDYLVHVSTEDYSYVNMHKKTLADCISSPDANLEVIEDVGLSSGSCLIENSGGIYDCSLGTEMEELSKKLKLLSYK